MAFTEELGRAIVVVRGGGEVGDSGLGLDVGEVAEAKKGGIVECEVGLGGKDNEEVEAVGVETVKLTLIAEARDDGLDAHDRRKLI